MNIKDYIHYYLGQPCVNSWFPEEHKEYNKGWRLMGIRHIESGKSYRLETEDEETWTDSVKPVLRRIKSLTTQELLQIARLAFFDQPMNYPDNHYRIVTEAGGSAHAVRIDNDWFEKELRIGHRTGNLWLSWKTAQTERIQNQPQIFHYLLSLGIDLFGLLDAGLAVDAETLKTEGNEQKG